MPNHTIPLIIVWEVQRLSKAYPSNTIGLLLGEEASRVGGNRRKSNSEARGDI